MQCSAIIIFNVNVLDAEGLSDDQYPLLCGNTISKGFRRPKNKQGIHDQRFYDAVRSHSLPVCRSFGCSPEVHSLSRSARWCWNHVEMACSCAGKDAANRCAQPSRCPLRGIQPRHRAWRAAIQCFLASLRGVTCAALTDAHLLRARLPACESPTPISCAKYSQLSTAYSALQAFKRLVVMGMLTFAGACESRGDAAERVQQVPLLCKQSDPAV